MLKSLKIKNFRCFEEFDLPQLGRVNLLVGKNKSEILPEQLLLFGMPTDGRKSTVGFINSSSTQPNEIIFTLKWEDVNDTISMLFIPVNTPRSNIHKNIYESKSSQLIHLSSSSMNTVITQFNQIVLTPQEDILYEALRTIEPGIERIAPVAAQGYRGARNGRFVVSINKQRVPIGSMGYGIWRMLGITLAMVNIPGGTLLIDEIDTGLHFSVMVDLWKLICKTAEKLDIQVFATTHNSDCWKSLAEVANSDDIASDDITIHRIERGKKISVVFNEREMAIAAERDIEVR